MKPQRRRAHAVLLNALLVVALSAAACGGKEDSGAAADKSSQAAEAEPLTRVTENGPVKATVSVEPAAPRLGDALTLTLTVEAEAGVEVELPAFGEALGRFDIVDFTPRREQEEGEGGGEPKTVYSQRYTLQAPMSGRQRIPSLRIEFVDARPGRTGDAGPTESRELLTDSIPIEIASVLPEGDAATELRPARGILEPPRVSRFDRAWPWLLAGLLLVLVAVGFVLWRRRARHRIRITAYDKAMARLAKLEGRGLPGADEADAWYVELSGIVRRYLEDRFALRAPELTTEEFLHVAQHSRELTREHRALLSSFLEGCDRVKFAGYRPAENESRDAIASARQFLAETRLVEEPKRSGAKESPPA